MDSISVEIKEYKGWLILKLITITPKIKIVGNGTSLINFNEKDLYISENALNIIYKNKGKHLNDKNPALEILNKNTLWWSAINKGMILKPNELLHIHDLPVFTLCDNRLDPELVETINKY